MGVVSAALTNVSEMDRIQTKRKRVMWDAPSVLPRPICFQYMLCTSCSPTRLKHLSLFEMGTHMNVLERCKKWQGSCTG